MAERSRSVLAAQAFERIKKLRAEYSEELAGAPKNIEERYRQKVSDAVAKLNIQCAEELAAAPDSITDRFNARIAKERAKLDQDVLEYVDGLIATEEAREAAAIAAGAGKEKGVKP
jgi:hypothetical protein